ncbi:MAG: hypothetical protein LVQ63_02500 [Thermoplasmatales archaeon]|nr:hypothetical protein [Thermoplasmatales archaeon]
MNAEDQRFWDGFLKGILACEILVEDMQEGLKNEKGSLYPAQLTIAQLKDNVERMLSRDTLKTLGERNRELRGILEEIR